MLSIALFDNLLAVIVIMEIVDNFLFRLLVHFLPPRFVPAMFSLIFIFGLALGGDLLNDDDPLRSLSLLCFLFGPGFLQTFVG